MVQKKVNKPSPQTTAALSTLTDVWAAVDIARSRYAATTVRPDNGFTLFEYCSKYNLCRQTAQNQLRRMIDEKEITVSKVLLPDGDGKIRQINVYVSVK